MIDNNQSNLSRQSSVSLLSLTPSESSSLCQSTEIFDNIQTAKSITNWTNNSCECFNPKPSLMCMSDLRSNDSFTDENDTQTIFSESAKTISKSCIDLGLKCTTPYGQNTHFKHHFLNEVLLFNEVCSFKLNFVNNLTSSESSEENLKENIEDRLIKRYIGKTLTGWDERGMHYWLHKINNSNLRLPIIEEIINDNESWYRIHFCETCVTQLNISNYFNRPELRQTKIMNNEIILLESNTSNENDINDSITNYQLKCSKSIDCNVLGLPEDNDAQRLLSNDDYVNRVVYSNNTCGLNYELFEKNKKDDKILIDESMLNSSFKVIVYGTDPCGLNFPVDLSGQEPGESNELVTCNGDVNGSSVIFYKDLNSCNEFQSNNILNEKSNTLHNINESTEYTNVEDKTEKTNSSNNCSNSSATTGHSTSGISSTDNKCEFFTIQSSLYSTDSSSSTGNSTGYTDSQSSEFSKSKTDESSSPTVQSLNSYINMNFKHSSTELLKESQENIPILSDVIASDKLFPSAYKNTENPSSLQQKRLKSSVKPLGVETSYSESFTKVIKSASRRQYSPSIIRFSKSTAMIIKSIYLGGRHGKIVFNHDLDSKDKIIIRAHSSTKVVQKSSAIPLLMIMYLSLVLFLVFCYIFLENSIREYSLSEPARKWYQL